MLSKSFLIFNCRLQLSVNIIILMMLMSEEIPHIHENISVSTEQTISMTTEPCTFFSVKFSTWKHKRQSSVEVIVRSMKVVCKNVTKHAKWGQLNTYKKVCCNKVHHNSSFMLIKCTYSCFHLFHFLNFCNVHNPWSS
jgi:hypothetical protein